MKKEHGIIHMGVVLIIVLAGIGGFVLLRNKPNLQSKVKQDKEIQKEVQNEDRQVEEDKYKDWKEYSQSDPGFSFKYPNDGVWKLEKMQTMGSMKSVVAYIGEDTFGSTCSFDVTTQDKPMENEDYQKSNASEIDTVTVDGVISNKYMVTPNDRIFYTSYSYFPVESVNGLYFGISYIQKTGNDCMDVLEDIFSTFEF